MPIAADRSASHALLSVVSAFVLVVLRVQQELIPANETPKKQKKG
jgi:hypothetical protein